jgi:hypothetical protein
VDRDKKIMIFNSRHGRKMSLDQILESEVQTLFNLSLLAKRTQKRNILPNPRKSKFPKKFKN